MSMEISGSYGQYKANYAERIQAEHGQIKEVQERKEEALDKKPIQDEYISSEKSATKPTGLYRLGQQLRSASGNEKKVWKLEKKLAQIESELSHKDNDKYRRQNAEIS